ncbi:hypothetical protein [Pilimelia anulata]|uniref:hypothetical protein n=1 Tax=Pilimelia anulata TaxID=53371 RepID=UPI001E2E28FC|nr:hypothetical protein [Pilimelia anulata]
MTEEHTVDETGQPGGAAAGREGGAGEAVDTPKENGGWPPVEPEGRNGTRYPSAAALWSTTYPPPSRWDWSAETSDRREATPSTLLVPDGPVLPHRVPVDDPPAGPAAAPPAQTPELARIATHLRRDDEPGAPRERPEGFDVDAVLGAAHDVGGVRGASLRTTPSGAHLLRLDLADGADAAHVSREVARMLQERLGLAAKPPRPAVEPEPRRIPQQSEPDRRPAHAAPDPVAPRPSRRGRRRAVDGDADAGWRPPAPSPRRPVDPAGYGPTPARPPWGPSTGPLGLGESGEPREPGESGAGPAGDAAPPPAARTVPAVGPTTRAIGAAPGWDPGYPAAGPVPDHDSRYPGADPTAPAAGAPPLGGDAVDPNAAAPLRPGPAGPDDGPAGPLPAGGPFRGPDLSLASGGLGGFAAPPGSNGAGAFGPAGGSTGEPNPDGAYEPRPGPRPDPRLDPHPDPRGPGRTLFDPAPAPAAPGALPPAAAIPPGGAVPPVGVIPPVGAVPPAAAVSPVGVTPSAGGTPPAAVVPSAGATPSAPVTSPAGVVSPAGSAPAAPEVAGSGPAGPAERAAVIPPPGRPVRRDPYGVDHPGGAPAGVAGRPGAPARVVIEHVGLTVTGLDGTVEVRLAAGDRTARGAASGPAVDRYVPRLCAAAAAAAIGELVAAARPGDAPGRCFVEHAAIVPLGTCEVAVVVILLVCDGWVEQLAGSAIVTGDRTRAAVRATMAAVNRLLDALL